MRGIQKKRKGHILLNSRSEYNRCAIPRISSKLGDKEIKAYNKETFEEEKREQIVVDKIKRIRKENNCERNVNLIVKRRQLENNDYENMLTKEGRPEEKEAGKKSKK